MKLAYFGSDAFSVGVLRHLLASKTPVEGVNVYTTAERSLSKSHDMTKFCNERNISIVRWLTRI